MSGARAALAAGLGALLAAAGVATATETQLWITDTAADYAKAEASGIVVRADGVLVLGPRARYSPADSLTVVWAVQPLADGTVALAGSGGRIERWTSAGEVRSWVRLPVGQVLCLVRDGDGLLAGTGPEGLVYRIGAGGDTALVARTGERYVWGLAPAGRGEWFAATGTRGRLLRIAGGATRVVHDSDETNLVSVVADGAGGVYAGGDSRGHVLHVRASGQARTLFDAPEDEIRALALGPGGVLHAAALSSSAVIEDGGEQRPEPVRAAVTGGRATVYRIVPDTSVAALWTSPQPFVFALAARDGRAPGGERPGVIVATGNRAGVYAVTGPGQGEQWLAPPQGQVTALAVEPGGRVWAGTSTPGGLWRLDPEDAGGGELVSPVHDARRYARFGRLHWRGDAGGGRVVLSTRTGNTDTPDSTWSPWSGGEGSGRRSDSPAGRYLQWRIELRGGRPRVDAVEAAWRQQNLPPRVDEVTILGQAQGVRDGEIGGRSESVTQTLPGGQRVEYSISRSPSRPLRDLPVFARGLRTVQWRGHDPNDDPLRYTIEIRPEEADSWTRLAADLEATVYTWDSHPFPDGRYRLRVTASDAVGNAVGEGLTGWGVSRPFTVDNTPPGVSRLEARGGAGEIVVSGRAEDSLSHLVRLEVAVDNEAWRLVDPEGGFADDRQLDFRVRIPGVGPGERTLAVRAVDAAGNTATRAVRVSVRAPR